MIPPAEIKQAISIALRENGTLDRNDPAIAVGRIFGLDRVGPDLKLAIENVIGNAEFTASI